MPTPLQYPLERSRALQEKWLQMLHKEPPQDDDDEDTMTTRRKTRRPANHLDDDE
jgi:hypothetical protein